MCKKRVFANCFPRTSRRVKKGKKNVLNTLVWYTVLLIRKAKEHLKPSIDRAHVNTLYKWDVFTLCVQPKEGQRKRKKKFWQTARMKSFLALQLRFMSEINFAGAFRQNIIYPKTEYCHITYSWCMFRFFLTHTRQLQWDESYGYAQKIRSIGRANGISMLVNFSLRFFGFIFAHSQIRFFRLAQFRRIQWEI